MWERSSHPSRTGRCREWSSTEVTGSRRRPTRNTRRRPGVGRAGGPPPTPWKERGLSLATGIRTDPRVAGTSDPDSESPGGPSPLARKRRRTGILLSLPALAVVVGLLGVPIGQAIYYS